MSNNANATVVSQIESMTGFFFGGGDQNMLRKCLMVENNLFLIKIKKFISKELVIILLLHWLLSLENFHKELLLVVLAQGKNL